MTSSTGASKVLIGWGVLLLFVFLVTELTVRRITFLTVEFFSGLALFAIVLGFLQPLSRLSEGTKSRAAWMYGLGIVLTASAFSWLDNLYMVRWQSLSDEVWESDLILKLFKIDLIFPALLLIPVLLTFAGLIHSRSEERMASQIYVRGGMLMVLLVLCQVWYGLFAKWFVSTSGGVASVSASLASYPTFLLLAVGAIVLGLLPGGAHLKGRFATAGAIGYIAGVFVFSIGIHLAIWPGSDWSLPLGTIGLILVCGPYIAGAWGVVIGKAGVV